MLQVGQKAPLFILPDDNQEDFDLSGFFGKRKVVLLFYPKDCAPNCTLEVTDFSDHDTEFLRHNCVLVGINRDDAIKHARFRDQNGIAIPLLTDEDGAVCKQYGVWQEKEVDGIKKFGVLRSTFIVDEAGILQFVAYGVAARGHALDILHVVKEMRA